MPSNYLLIHLTIDTSQINPEVRKKRQMEPLIKNNIYNKENSLIIMHQLWLKKLFKEQQFCWKKYIKSNLSLK
jgi:hypothetical protein